jgi:putative DNA primase/helicase
MAIYTQHGLSGPLKLVDTGGLSDFQWIIQYKPQEITQLSTEQIHKASEGFKAKRALYVFAGDFKRLKRNDENLKSRSVLFADYDSIPDEQAFIDSVKATLADVNYYLYPTPSYNMPDVRYRLAIQLDQSITKASNAQTLLRQWLNAKLTARTDEGAKAYSQPMGLPCTNTEAKKLPNQGRIVNQGKKPLDVSRILKDASKVPRPAQATGGNSSTEKSEKIPDRVAIAILKKWTASHKDKLQTEAASSDIIIQLVAYHVEGAISRRVLKAATRILASVNPEKAKVWEKGNLEKLKKQYRRRDEIESNMYGFKTLFGAAELKPFNVYATDPPEAAALEDKTILDEINRSMAFKTPKWLTVKWIVNGKGASASFKLVVRVNEVKFGDWFLEENNIQVFSAMPNGVLYNGTTGKWQKLGNRELQTVVEAKATDVFTAWGVYNTNLVTRVRLYIQRKAFNSDMGDRNPFNNSKPELVVFENGTYDMMTGAMRENRPEDYILNAHAYKIEPKVNQAPETEKLLTGMFGVTNVVTIEEFLGYCFYRSHAPIQSSLWVTGDGGEGKSTVLNIFRDYLFGADNVASEAPDALTGRDRFSLARLFGKEINLMPDIGRNHLANTDKLKALTGGDSLSAEFKGQDKFSFASYAKLIFSANEAPTFSDDTSGFKDRLLRIKAINGNTREHPDWWTSYNMVLVKSEMPAFAVLCMQKGAEAVRRHSLTKSAEALAASAEWFKDNDYLGQFLEQYCECDPTSDKGCKSSAFLASYNVFLSGNGYRKVSTQKVKSKLERRGFSYIRSRCGYEDKAKVWRYMGIKLVGDPMNEFSEED